MKKILLISDIHGNLPALEAVLESVQDQTFEAILSNGDMIYGANPNQCIEKLLKLNAIMIAGNIETNIIRLSAKLCPPEWYQCEQYAYTRHIAKILSHQNLLHLYKLSETLVIENLLPGSIQMVHGSPAHQYEWISPLKNDGRFEEILENCDHDFLIFGHTHHQWDQKHAGVWAINPGSVGMPLDGKPEAQYTIITYEEGQSKSVQVHHHSVKYDTQQAIKNFHNQGFDSTNPFIKHVFYLLTTGKKREDFFVTHYINLAQQESGKPFDQLSCQEKNKYWFQADQTYDWKS